MDAVEQLRQDVREGRIAVDRLIDVIGTLQRKLEAALQRIEELEKNAANPTPPAAGSPGKIEQPFSMRAEEKRQRQRGKSDKHKLSRNGRRGRLGTADKLKRAERTEKCFPEGVPHEECRRSHTRPVWRLEDGRAVLVAYEIYRGPKNQYGKISGVLGRGEFGMEVIVQIAYMDAATLEQILDPATFTGTVISDDAAVYANFSQSQKCWAHLLRKAIKLTLQEPDNREYRQFTDRLLEIYRQACRVPRDGRLSDAGRSVKVAALAPAQARDTGRANKSTVGARRQTIIVSVLESMRVYLKTFALKSIVAEMERWRQAGQSCFRTMLNKLKLRAPAKSPLDKLLPVPDG